MRYQTESKGEYTYLIGEFATGETVTIVIYNILTGFAGILDSNSCAEIGTTGWFRWNTQEITTPATAKTDYLYIMTDSNGMTYAGKFIIGGYVDKVDVSLSSIQGEIESLGDDIGSVDSKSTDILADTNELQLNQGNWLTATGFAIANEYDLPLSLIQAEVNGLNGAAMRGTDEANTVIPDNAGIAQNGVSISKLNNFNPDTETVTTDAESRDASKATGFATLNPPSQNLGDYKANTTGLGLAGEYDARMATIQADLDNTGQYKADLSGIENLVIDIAKLTGNKVTKSGDIITIYETDGVTTWRQYDLADGGRVIV